MESRWRQNVVKIGWGTSDMRLAARMLDWYPSSYLVSFEGTPLVGTRWEWLGPGHLAFDAGGAYYTGGHFPFGQRVETDRI